jgi:hypothetical protein
MRSLDICLPQYLKFKFSISPRVFNFRLKISAKFFITMGDI